MSGYKRTRTGKEKHDMKTILAIFIIAFFTVSVISLFTSIVNGKVPDLATSCRKASWMAFFIGLIMLYLRFVLA